jgi:protein-tyrosine phosphatase
MSLLFSARQSRCNLLSNRTEVQPPNANLHKHNSAKMKRILFLCTGNYYRSRYAEIYFNWQAERRGLPWIAESRGLAVDGSNYGPISCHTVTRLKKQGIKHDVEQRFPLPLSEADLVAADHVVAVKEAEHRPLIASRFPTWSDQIEYWHIHDLDCATPENAIPHLENELVQLIDRLAA